MTKMTPVMIDQAVEMRERGLSYAVIGRKLGVSESAISWHCLKEGADSPKARPISKAIRGPAEVKRGNHVVRRFSPADDAAILQLEAEGKSIADIARRLGRRHNSIKGRLYTLARHEARAEAAS